MNNSSAEMSGVVQAERAESEFIVCKKDLHSEEMEVGISGLVGGVIGFDVVELLDSIKSKNWLSTKDPLNIFIAGIDIVTSDQALQIDRQLWT